MPSPVKPKPIIPAMLDDAGLTMPQFRIYCRAVRRWSKRRGCDESVGEMARGCRMNRKTAERALADLVAMGMLTKAKRKGRPARYDPTHTYPISVPTPNEYLPQSRHEPTPLEALPPTPLEADEGITSKELPEGVTKNGRSPKFDPPCPPEIEPTVWEDWKQHRKEIRKPLTRRSYSLQCAKLAAFKENGRDPNLSLTTSIENGWTGIFEPDAKNGTANPAESYARISGAIDAAFGAE